MGEMPAVVLIDIIHVLASALSFHSTAVGLNEDAYVTIDSCVSERQY